MERFVNICRKEGVDPGTPIQLFLNPIYRDRLFVKLKDGRVSIGPCVADVSVVYKLDGIIPVLTTDSAGNSFYVPRTNTFRADGEYIVYFNTAGTYSVNIPICEPEEYGVDVFAWSHQIVNVTSVPVVPIEVTSEQGGSQTKHQLKFRRSAQVYVNVSPNPNGRMVTFSVDMSGPIAAGTHTTSQWVEVRGSFNNFAGGSEYRLARNGNIYSGAFVIVGTTGSSVLYKFYGQSITWESRPDRTLVLGSAQIPQAEPPAVWNV